MKRNVYLIFTIIFMMIMLSSCSGISTFLSQKSEQFKENDTGKVSEETQVIQSSTDKINYDIMNGVWISYIEYGQIMTEKCKDEFENNICVIFDNLKSKNINTAIVQVRSHSDAYYNSSYYPWSRYVTGTVGKSPDYDPLKIMVEQAHKRDISIHAWVNPYRLTTDEQFNLIDDSYIIKQWYQNSEYMAKYNDYWYLNPFNEQVQELIANGVDEICKNYNIDGVQIDDYFFSAPPSSFNLTEEQARESTTSLVKKLYDTVKKNDENILFGVSPGGNYTEKPKSDETQYTNLELWCTDYGYMDYVAPQIYWAFDDEVAPFENVLSKWKELCNEKKVKLIIGLAGYKFAGAEEFTNQINYVSNDEDLSGYIIFRYENIK